MRLNRFSAVLFFGLLTITSYAFHHSFTTFRVSLRRTEVATTSRSTFVLLMSSSSADLEENGRPFFLEPSIAEQFKIKICSSTSCMKRYQVFGLDEYALYSGLYQRKEDNGASAVQIEEGPCMGRCKFGPCIGIEHEDYEGFIGLEGMEPQEMSCRVFQK